MPTPRDILAANRKSAIAFAQVSGSKRTRLILENAERELVARLASMPVRATATFSRESLTATLLQVREVLRTLNGGLQRTLVAGAEEGAVLGAQGTIDYLERVESQFRGVGTAPLALDQAAMFEQAKVGARASVLRRLVSSGEGAPGAPREASPAKPGILQRYGIGVLGDFEQELQVGVVARKSWEEVKSSIVSKSSFLQGKPSFWAERIVRTESMGALARGSWEATREADDQLGDMVKILSATFDERTGSDSVCVHGMLRRPDEAFESWFGLYQHPPNRPNDREIVVPHRLSWPLPGYLTPRTDAEVAARWKLEKRKGPVPPRPLMSTIPASAFGKKPPSRKATEERAPRERVPDDE